MRTILTVILTSIVFSTICYGNGVAVTNAPNGVYLHLDSSFVSTEIENQVGITTVRNSFTNNSGSSASPKYCYPLPEGASATGLRWSTAGVWHVGEVSIAPQDTVLPGGAMNDSLKAYLGDTPFYFNLGEVVPSGSTILVEFTYVELLPYAWGDITYTFKNDYHQIQVGLLSTQSLELTLTSTRTLDTLYVASTHPQVSLNYGSNSGSVSLLLSNVAASEDYSIVYRLNTEELGLFSYTTFLPSGSIPDNHQGFYLLIMEPDVSGTLMAMNKNFTLVVDKSGSMGGTKIEDVKLAAAYIVNALNPGDHFNIVDFCEAPSSFRTGLVANTTTARDSAIAYINALEARGGTNIQGAFDTAIPPYAYIDTVATNIIIFLTDGKPTSGLTARDQLVAHIDETVTATNQVIHIYTIGVGTGENIDTQLLAQISSHNSGQSRLVGHSYGYDALVEFYNWIRYPALLNPTITFEPNNLTEVYPDPLPDLYLGHQEMVAGRYDAAGTMTSTLSGTSFGIPLSFQFNLTLSDTAATHEQFLTKIWAKLKIESLLAQYYDLDSTSTEAQDLRTQINWLSVNYGVVSPFGSLVNQNPTAISQNDVHPVAISDFEIQGNYPNPFNASTSIQFSVSKHSANFVNVKIYNALGQLVQVLTVHTYSTGDYSVTWNGTTSSGELAPSGSYVYTISYGNTVLGGRMSMIK